MRVLYCIAPKLPEGEQEDDGDIEGSTVEGNKNEDELQHDLV